MIAWRSAHAPGSRARSAWALAAIPLGLFREAKYVLGTILAAGDQAARRQPSLGQTGRKASDMVSIAQRHTHFLDSPRMAAVLDRSDFAFADLRR